MTKLNKITSVLLSAIMVIGIFSIIPFAAGAETSGSFEYDVLDDGTASITDYIDNGSKTVDIPSTIDGYKVTGIGAAFGNCTGITDITIPNTVTYIRMGAFYNCTGLKKLVIPNGVKDIHPQAFQCCTGLENISVDANNKNFTSVDGVLFSKDKTDIVKYPNAKKGASYIVPNTVTRIYGMSFETSTNLTSVTIPGSVEVIGFAAFGDCTNLKSVIISNGVKTIGDSAFDGCTSLTSVTIPSSVTEIGDYAFGYTYDDTLVKIKGFTIYGKKGTAAERYAKDNGFKFVEGTAPAEPAVPTGVKLNQSSLTLGKGESYGLISTVLPANAKNKTCTWSTSNSSAATVSNTGKVTAKAVGTATITVKTVNGKTATCKVTVKPAPTSVKINPTALTLGKGESYTVSESTSKGSYANGANLKWTSTNTRVATVQKGKGNKAVIKAVGTGTANIKITLFNGKTATCKVTVKPLLRKTL